MSDRTFKEVVEKTKEVIEAFKKVEQRNWGIEGSMIELMKQVGQLSQNIMVFEKYYLSKRDENPFYNKASKDEIGNELSDILFMVIRIASHYDIDLESAHMKEMELAEESLKG